MECTPNRESLLALIQPDMKLTKEFLKRIYAFEISYPGFSEEAIAACPMWMAYHTGYISYALSAENVSGIFTRRICYTNAGSAQS